MRNIKLPMNYEGIFSNLGEHNRPVRIAKANVD